MKKLLTVLLAALVLPLASGCATPAYSGGLPTIKFPREKATGENANNVVRAWHHDSRELIDDVNHVLLIDRPSQLTKWHIR
jgi:hypothetical protein